MPKEINDWEDTPSPTSEINDWEDIKDVSELESGIRGALQGVTAGFSDELSGGIEALWEKAKGDPSTFGELYKAKRDTSRAANKAAELANPASYTSGNIAGAVGSAFIPGLGGATLGKLALQGAATGLGTSEAELTEGDITGAAKDTAIGTGIGVLSGVGGKLVGNQLSKVTPYVQSGINKLGDVFETGAEKLAVKATGATGNQASKFAPSAGRELLDQGLIKFGDDAAKIADRVGQRHAQAGTAIGDALEALEQKGVTGSVDNVVAALKSQVDELSKVPGNEKIIKQLQGEIDNLYNRGQSDLGFKGIEEAKRIYQGQTNFSSPEFEKKASTQVARAFKDESERSAIAADPGLAKSFIDQKKMFGLLSPVKEATEKRALQQAQSPFGGLLDMGAGLYGISDSDSNFGKAALAIAGRRVLVPRIASSAAVGLDKLGSILKSNPQFFGKFAPVLEAAERRGGLAATNFILQQTNPEYQKLMLQQDNDDKE